MGAEPPRAGACSGKPRTPIVREARWTDGLARGQEPARPGGAESPAATRGEQWSARPANPRFVESTADDWLQYPDLKGRRRRFSCEEWATPHRTATGQPDYHRNYMRWWLSHLPKAPGAGADGRRHNWWDYLFDFNAFDASGKPLSQVKPGETGSVPAASRKPA